MARECWDCFYSHPIEGMRRYHCDKKKKNIYGDDPACDSFVSDEKQSCSMCLYCETNPSIFAGSDSYICARTNKKIRGSDVQCSRFVPD